MSTVYIQTENVDHTRLNNNTGAALAQYEFTVIGKIACVADVAIANGSVGSFHTEDGILIQASDFVAGELTFGTVNQDVFWDPSSGDFSDTSTSTYYKVGILQTVKDSNGVIVFALNKQVELVSAHAAIATNTANIAKITAEGGIPFFKAVTITAIAAGTAIDILTDAEVIALNAAGVVVITSFLLNVNGGTAWSDATATIVDIQDKAGTPVTGLSVAKAQLTANAQLNLLSTGVTLSEPIADGIGFTAATGIELVGDADFTAGSDIIVTIAGYVI